MVYFCYVFAYYFPNRYTICLIDDFENRTPGQAKVEDNVSFGSGDTDCAKYYIVNTFSMRYHLRLKGYHQNTPHRTKDSILNPSEKYLPRSSKGEALALASAEFIVNIDFTHPPRKVA